MVRQKACLGELPVPLPEKIEILVLLAEDRNEESRNCALHTLESWPPKELQQVLSVSSTPAAVLEFAAYNLAPSHKELRDGLLQNPSLSPPLREWIETIASLFAEAEASDASEAAISADGENSSGEEEPQKKLTPLQRIQRMSALQKIKAALTGSQEERLILIRDSNRLVAQTVLESAKLSDHEVENFASMKDVDEEVLRLIAANRKFMKNYRVVRALVNNPRTPIDVGIPLIKRTSDQDLRWLVLNRNVSQVIRIGAQKRIRQKEAANKTKFPGFR